MGEEDNPDGEVVETIETGVEIKAHDEQMPVTVSVWDDGEMVHEPVAALQMDEIVWWAEGYVEAKTKYGDIQE